MLPIAACGMLGVEVVPPVLVRKMSFGPHIVFVRICSIGLLCLNPLSCQVQGSYLLHVDGGHHIWQSKVPAELQGRLSQ